MKKHQLTAALLAIGVTFCCSAGAIAEDALPPTGDNMVAVPLADTAPAAAQQPMVIGDAPATRHSWQKLNNYDNAGPDSLENSANTAPAANGLADAPSSGGIKFNDSVNVYPVDGDNLFGTYHGIMNGSVSSVTGERVQEIFFAHGSSQISKIDRKNLHELASSLAHDENAYKVAVVGHTSTRVNGVSDPVARKKINFHVAQKRADAVVHEMTSAGLPQNVITAASAGEDEPNAHPNGKPQEAADRRAEVFVSDE